MILNLNKKKQLKISAIATSLSLLLASSGALPVLAASNASTASPIKHIVVIYQENVSFDHYFGTYPYATNPPNQPIFKRGATSPGVNGFSGLLYNNPNAYNSANGTAAINPFRLDRSQVSTCDQDHAPGNEQKAYNNGLLDSFPASTGDGNCTGANSQFAWGKGKGVVMGYFDGNTVTAYWNYAQNFAMSDNFFGSQFGPSTPGALNLVAGNTYPATPSKPDAKVVAVDGNGTGTLTGDLDPTGDACSTGTTVKLGGKNIGDLLNAKGISWGAFMGGFDLSIKNEDGSTGCKRQSPATPANGGPAADYIPHHAWFQYYASTQNLNHDRPTVSPELYGSSADTVANHQYDVKDFSAALAAGNLPAVSFIKAPANMDGHSGYSDPLLEQQFVVGVVNAVQSSPFWKETAIIIAYDDSDGWYDHQMPPIINPSAINNPASASYTDQLNGVGKCGNFPGAALKDDNGKVINGRCGYGARLPLLILSPYAKKNYVDHTLTDQASILRFIEDNWELGRIGNGSFDAQAGKLVNLFDFTKAPVTDTLILDPNTGNPSSQTNCFFNWAQKAYSKQFSPANTNTLIESPNTYRYYSGTKTSLGISGNNNHVYAQKTGGAKQDMGQFSVWQSMAGCK